MAVTVKKIVLWRGEIEHRSGALANALTPLAEAGADLQVVMAYGYASDKGAVELYPRIRKEGHCRCEGSRVERILDSGAVG